MILRPYSALLRPLAIPFYRFRLIFCHAIAIFIASGEVVDSLYIISFRQNSQPGNGGCVKPLRLSGIFFHATPIVITNTKAI